MSVKRFVGLLMDRWPHDAPTTDTAYVLAKDYDALQRMHNIEVANHRTSFEVNCGLRARIAQLEAALREAIKGHEIWESVYGSSASSREHLEFLKSALGSTAETHCNQAAAAPSDAAALAPTPRGSLPNSLGNHHQACATARGEQECDCGAQANRGGK